MSGLFYLAKADGRVIGKFTEEELRAKISAGDASPDDQYLAEGAREWKRAAEFPGARFPWPAPSAPNRTQRKKEDFSPVKLGALCAICAAFLPLVHPVLFLASVALLIASFVLAILAIVRGKVSGGVLLLIGIFFAFPTSCVSLIDREKLLHREAR